MPRRLSLPIAHPCPESARLRGSGAVLHCDRCDAPVHDLSALTRAQALTFLHGLVGRPKPCLRYAVDTDGEIQFRPAPPRPVGGWAAVAAGAVLALAPADAAAAEPTTTTATSSATSNEPTADAPATAAPTPATDAPTPADDDSAPGCPLPTTAPAGELTVLGGVPPETDRYYGVSKREHRRWRRAERRRQRREQRAARRSPAVA